MDSLAEMGDNTAKAPVTRRIEQLNQEYQELGSRIQELEGLTSEHALSDIEFDLLRQLLTVFRDGIDEMTVGQKRAAIRTVIRKVVWDGVNAHVVLFGIPDEEIEYPVITAAASDASGETDETDKLVPIADVDCEDGDLEEPCPGNPAPTDETKTLWGEGSKTYLIPGQISYKIGVLLHSSGRLQFPCDLPLS